MSIDFTPGVINTYNGDIYNCTTNTDNVKTPDTPKWPCDNREEQHPINAPLSGEWIHLWTIWFSATTPTN